MKGGYNFSFPTLLHFPGELLLIRKYAFYCYYITFYDLELSTFCNNLISLIVSYFNKTVFFFFTKKNPGERFDWSIDIVAVDKRVM